MSQQTPAQKVIERVFLDYKNDGYSGDADDDVWEVFVADLLLRSKALDDEEIRSGIVDGKRDGGIDAFYTFLNGALVQDDHPALGSEIAASKHVGDTPTIEVLVTQSKNKASWQETVLEKLLSSLSELLDESLTLEFLHSHFRESLVRQVSIFRSLSENLAVKFPRFTFKVVYATRASEKSITDTIVRKSEQVEQLIRLSLTPGAAVSCELLGADRIYELAGTVYSAPAELRLRNTIIREEGSFLGIASLEDYLSFVRNENDDLRSEMFESNVRDFEGSNVVNRSIQETLANPSDAEFWWQNNGVTILGRRVNAPNQILTIEQPLIVNGLQTTHVLHQAERLNRLDDSRKSEGVLIRVIESDDDAVRDQVIAGTNRQTQVSGAALFATDILQVDIERFFLANDWFYERRKNRYKNLKKPAARRVSINLLAQAIISLDRGEPDAARGRPTTVLTKDYERIFNSSIELPVYLRAAQLLYSVSSFLRTNKAKEVVNDYSNIRFYLLIGTAMAHLGARDFNSLKFRENHSRLPEAFEEAALLEALERVSQLFFEYSRAHQNMTRDSIAKSSDFRRWFLDNVNVQPK